MLGNYRVAAQVVASRVVISSIELVSQLGFPALMPLQGFSVADSGTRHQAGMDPCSERDSNKSHLIPEFQSDPIKHTPWPLARKRTIPKSDPIKNKQTPWPLVRERTIPTERPPKSDPIDKKIKIYIVRCYKVIRHREYTSIYMQDKFNNYNDYNRLQNYA
jgi:hypothetical protein